VKTAPPFWHSAFKQNVKYLYLSNLIKISVYIYKMSLFTAAMDNYQLGENGHAENKWAKGSEPENIQEQLVQFSFQCVRTTSNGLDSLSEKLESLLTSIKTRILNETDIVKKDMDYLVRCFQLIGMTRDIESGKGERDLAYMMLFIWWGHFPRLAEQCFQCFMNPVDGKVPYGSWKDVKRLCQYIHLKTGSKTHPFIEYAADLMCSQLRADSNTTQLSLVARWVPRESSSTYGWLFCKLAAKMFPEYLETAEKKGGHERKTRALTKAKMMLSRLIVQLNRRLDTPQIKMCGGDWSNINPHCVPSVLLMKNRAAFLNKTKKGEQKKDTVDRMLCAKNFEEYINERVKTGKAVKGSKVGITDFVKQGIELKTSTDVTQQAVLNAQWEDFISKMTGGQNIVAMVDQSGSMLGDPYHAAMGLGLAIASKSALGRRVMTFSSNPRWISLEKKETLIDGIKELTKYDGESGLGTDFFKALTLLLNACVSASLPNDVVAGMTLAILSDMQIDNYTNKVASDDDIYARTDAKPLFDKRMEDMHTKISRMYNEAGYTDVPHLLFWNLRHTSGFPTLSSMKGATMFSGFSPMLLNSFCMKGTEALKQTSPWDSFCALVDGDRYGCLRQIVEDSELSTHS